MGREAVLHPPERGAPPDVLASFAEAPLRRELPALAAVAVCVFAGYATIGPPTVTLEDSGLLTTNAWAAGIAHPPGYPLYTAIAWAATHVPIGSVAYRVNLVSAASAALACAALVLCARRMGLSRFVAVSAGFTYAATTSLWSQAVVAEVYALHALLFFATLAVALDLARRFDPTRARLLALLYGLGLSNHWPLLVLASGAFGVVLWHRRSELLRDAPALLGCMALGLLPYLWMPLRSLAGAEITMFGTLRDLRDLGWYLSMTGYGHLRVSEFATLADRLAYAELAVRRLLEDAGPLGALAAGLGTFWMVRTRRWRLGAALLLAIASTAIVFRLILAHTFTERGAEYLLAYQVVPAGAWVLCAALAAKLAPRRPGLVNLAAGAILVSTVALHFEANDRRTDTLALDYARAVLRAVPQGATLVVGGAADTGPLAYAHLVEGMRPDLHVVSATGAVFPTRAFDPMRVDAPGARAGLAGLLEREGVVYSPMLGRVMPMLGVAPHEGATSGLLSQVGARVGPVPLSPFALQAVREVLDREAAGRYSPHWPSLRREILGALCATLALRGERHPLMTRNAACARAAGLLPPATHPARAGQAGLRRGGATAEQPSWRYPHHVAAAP